MNVPNKAKGFTIIEVVLVLAIAGLIFLVVFLALPALQRGQRDNQRKQDLSKMMSQVVAYQSNNQGALPSGSGSGAGTWDTFVSNYLTNNNAVFSDPSSGSTYVVTPKASAASASTGDPSTIEQGNIWVYAGFSCTNVSSGASSGTGGSRALASIVFQEQGKYTCQQNQ